MSLYSDLWAEICFLLSENINSSLSEKDFENQVVRALEVLGWREFKGDIARQPVIQLGREGSLRPDLVIYDQNKVALIVLEVKRPIDDIAKDNTIGQLRSYMRQMKSEFGFLIGSEIRVYYDGLLNPQPDPLLLDKISFDRKLPEGEMIAQYFNKKSFLNKEQTHYLENKIKKFNKKQEIKKLTELLTAEDTKQKIIGLLRKEFADYGDETFSEAMEKVSIEIISRAEPIGNKLTNNQLQDESIRSSRRRIIRPFDQNKNLPENAEYLQDAAKITTMPFESHVTVRLRHIYGVLYFMKQGLDFPSATKKTLLLFPDVQDYQTISDKCARGFAGSVETFISWFNTGEILEKLSSKFNLSDHDYEVFKNLLQL